jgi:predicted nucleotidyltransferase
MKKEEILKFLKQNKTFLHEKFGVKKIGLFGSYARDEAQEGSDVDIIISAEKKDFFIREDLREFLENHFHKSVDIGYFENIREFYKRKLKNEIIYV